MIQATMSDYTKIPLVFNVHKPVGRASFHPVYTFRKNLNYDFGKIGHFGTLDPFANGVLLIGVQGAQKMNDYVHQFKTKTYEALGIFGIKTKSGDFETDIIEEKNIELEFQNLTKDELEEIICWGHRLKRIDNPELTHHQFNFRINMFWNKIFCLVLILQSASGQRHFKRMLFPANVWPLLVYTPNGIQSTSK